VFYTTLMPCDFPAEGRGKGRETLLREGRFLVLSETTGAMLRGELRDTARPAVVDRAENPRFSMARGTYALALRYIRTKRAQVGSKGQRLAWADEKKKNNTARAFRCRRSGKERRSDSGFKRRDSFSRFIGRWADVPSRRRASVTHARVKDRRQQVDADALVGPASRTVYGDAESVSLPIDDIQVVEKKKEIAQRFPYTSTCDNHPASARSANDEARKPGFLIVENWFEMPVR